MSIRPKRCVEGLNSTPLGRRISGRRIEQLFIATSWPGVVSAMGVRGPHWDKTPLMIKITPIVFSPGPCPWLILQWSAPFLSFASGFRSSSLSFFLPCSSLLAGLRTVPSAQSPHFQNPNTKSPNSERGISAKLEIQSPTTFNANSLAVKFAPKSKSGNFQ